MNKFILDIIVKFREKDLISFLQLQEDLIKHSKVRGNIYVIVPFSEHSRLVNFINKEFFLIVDRDVFLAFDYMKSVADSWITQQIIKILMSKFVSNDHYLILDSNTLINFDFNESFFFEDGQFIYAVGDYTDVAWELQSRNFLNIFSNTPLLGFRSVNQIFGKFSVSLLIDYLENLYSLNIVEVLLKYSKDLQAKYWTEYSLYGVFCQHFVNCDNHRFVVRNDVMYFLKNHDQVDGFIRKVSKNKPLMIKLYMHRKSYEMTQAEYRLIVDRIKREVLWEI